MKTGRILCHPFHNGLEGVGMGAGPSRLLGDGVFVDELRAADWRIETIEAPQAADPEIVRIAEADRRLARRVRAAAEGGLSLLQLEEAIDLVFGSFEVAAAAITAYDPEVDEDGRMARSARRVLRAVARGAVTGRAG